MFKKAKHRYWTWESPNKETHNLIEYILVSNKNLIQDCGVITTADVGSDRTLIRAKIRLDNKLLRLKRNKKQ